MDNINETDIRSLIEHFSQTLYKAKNNDDMAQGVMQKCIEIAKLDYNVSVLDNSSGELCAHYPSQLILMESEINTRDTIYEAIDSHKLRELIIKARSARCRTRFPIPVIFYQGKSICRSATLSGGAEIYGRSSYEFFFSGHSSVYDEQWCEKSCKSNEQDRGDGMHIDDDENSDQENGDKTNDNDAADWPLCNQVRQDDIKLLKLLSVGTIVDFMVEKKKVKFGMNVTSSEKVDKENRYSEFTILSLPYPGCEFFKEFRDDNYTADNLYFNWSQTHVDAEIIVPQDSITDRIQVKWKDYKNWNLPMLTQNYLVLLLRYIYDSSNGLLIHCISGWDRTPLFISLIRICLWADGYIHKSLTPIQMLYFTIAYDWFLFGHDLRDRKYKGEDIFYFCFYFLKSLVGDEYCSQRCKINKTAPVSGQLEYLQCEPVDLEGGEMNLQGCSQGSTYSLNSSWSSISSKSQEMTPLCQSEDLSMTGGIWVGDSSQPQRISDSQQSSSSSGSFSSTLTDITSESQKLLMAKMSLAASTSPVAVPTRTNLRQRNESSSSHSTGSWQYVSSTGSLRSSGSTISSGNSRNSVPDTTASDAGAPGTDVPDGSTNKRKHSDHSQCGSCCAVRRERLVQIRKLFSSCYCQSIGHTLKDGSESSGITNFFGSFAGKMYMIHKS